MRMQYRENRIGKLKDNIYHFFVKKTVQIWQFSSKIWNIFF
jgi:hypothetical protein